LIVGDDAAARLSTKLRLVAQERASGVKSRRVDCISGGKSWPA
jgi:hypothetical protein